MLPVASVPEDDVSFPCVRELFVLEPPAPGPGIPDAVPWPTLPDLPPALLEPPKFSAVVVLLVWDAAALNLHVICPWEALLNWLLV